MRVKGDKERSLHPTHPAKPHRGQPARCSFSGDSHPSRHPSTPSTSPRPSPNYLETRSSNIAIAQRGPRQTPLSVLSVTDRRLEAKHANVRKTRPRTASSLIPSVRTSQSRTTLSSVSSHYFLVEARTENKLGESRYKLLKMKFNERVCALITYRHTFI